VVAWTSMFRSGFHCTSTMCAYISPINKTMSKRQSFTSKPFHATYAIPNMSSLSSCSRSRTSRWSSRAPWWCILLCCSPSDWRQQALFSPKVDQWLHGLNLLVTDEVEELADVDEVNEARVKLLVCTHVPEGVQPVAVVNMGIASHHLTVDTLNVSFKGFGEARRLSEPLASGKLGRGGIDVGGWERLRGGIGRHGARGIC